MSVPANLFIETPDVQDLSLTRLSTDVKAWPEEIVQKFKERIPESAGVQMVVKFTKQDPENATATGAIMLSTAGKTGVVPVIVRESMMHPLDVLIAEGRELPLTPDFFAAIFSQNGAFASVEEYPVTFGGGIQGFAGADPSITNTTYPPSMTRYAAEREKKLAASYYAQAQKKLAGVKSILEEILPTVTDEQVKEFKTTIEKNAAYLSGYKRNGTIGLVAKITDRPLKTLDEKKVDDSAAFEAVKKPFIMARAVAPGKFEILANEYGEFSPAFRPVNKKQMREFISDVLPVDPDGIMKELEMGGEKVLRSKGPVTQGPLTHEREEKDLFLEDAETSGVYTVRTKGGQYTKGLVLPYVIDFDQNRLPYKVFLGKNAFSIQDKIVGMKVSDDARLPPDQVPAAGETGVFVFMMNGKALCTGPVAINCVVEDMFGDVLLHVTDHDGQPLDLKLSTAIGLQRIARVPSEVPTYLIPPSMQWVRCGKFTEVSSTKDLFHTKVAAFEGSTGLTATLISQGYNTYSMNGVETYTKSAGWDATNLDSSKVKFLLHSLGKDVEDCDQILKVAKSHGYIKVSGLQRPVMAGYGSEKTASTHSKKAKLASLLRRDLFKEAAMVESAQTVDSLLALNFVNPDNIAKMVSKIPQLKATISACASLLLASRLGLSEIPEQSTSTAMMRLLEVTDGLEKLRASQQTQAETA